MPAENCIAAIVIDHSATSADMEAVFDFFGLPRETRDAVHEFALLPDKPKVLELQVDPYRQQKRFKHPYINILKKPNINWMLANKQVCAEYQSVVKKYTTVHLTTNGSWDLAKIGEWLPRGVTLGLLQQLQTWTITLDWVHWNRFVNAHLEGPGDPSDPESSLQKLLRHQRSALSGVMSPQAKLTWQIDCGRGHAQVMVTQVQHDYDCFRRCIAPAKLREVLWRECVKIEFIAHTAMFLATEPGEKGKVRESPDYVRWDLEPSSDPGALRGWTWSFREVYPRYVAQRPDGDLNRCSIMHGDWVPSEVYGDVLSRHSFLQ